MTTDQPSSPSGTVTLLFTDIEGSTRLWEERPAEMGRSVERHDEIMQSTVASHGGYVFTTAGDSFAVAFDRAGDAAAAAIALGVFQASGYSAPIAGDLVTLAQRRINTAIEPANIDRYLSHGRSLDVMEATIETLDALDAAITDIDGRNTPKPDPRPI